MLEASQFCQLGKEEKIKCKALPRYNSKESCSTPQTNTNRSIFQDPGGKSGSQLLPGYCTRKDPMSLNWKHLLHQLGINLVCLKLRNFQLIIYVFQIPQRLLFVYTKEARIYFKDCTLESWKMMLYWTFMKIFNNIIYRLILEMDY